MLTTVVQWVVLALFFVWQAVLTWVVLRSQDDPTQERHRMARLACAMSDLTERFERATVRSLERLERSGPVGDHLGSGMVERPSTETSGPAWMPCPSCDGTGYRMVDDAPLAASPEPPPRVWDRPESPFGGGSRHRSHRTFRSRA